MKSSVILAVLLFCSSLRAVDFTTPLGIPDPADTWGAFDPIRTDKPDTTTYCPGWHEGIIRDNTRAAGDARNAYYIDNTHPSATDTSNTYGRPDRPRLTIPAIVFTAGDYIEIHGDGSPASIASPYTVASFNPRGVGTDTAPIWFVGVDQPVFTGTMALGFSNTAEISYLIFDGLQWRGGGKADIRPKFSNNDIHHIAMRNCVFRGTESSTDATGFAVGSSSTSDLTMTMSDFVFYGGTISHYGDFDNPGEECGIYVRYVIDGFWALDSEISYTAEDGMQFSHTGKHTATGLYVGRCNIHHNLTNALDIKGTGGPVVFSQNYIHDHEDIWVAGVHKSTGTGEACVFHYAGSSSGANNYLNYPEDVSFLFNTVEGGRMGVATSSCGRLRIVGNTFKSSRRLPTNYGDSPSCLDIRGIKGDMWISQNTFYDCEGTIRIWDAPLAYNAGTTYYIGSTVSYSGATYVCINENGGTGTVGTDPSNASYWQEITVKIYGNIIANTYDGNDDIKLDGATFAADSILSGYNNIYNPAGTAFTNYALQTGDITTNPLLTNPAGGDFTIPTGSPAKDAGDPGPSPTAHGDYLTRYGTSLALDKNGGSRPEGAAWDIGAYEYGAGDFIAPSLTAATIPAGGTTMVLTFSEAVDLNTGGTWALSLSSGSSTATYSSGTGTNTLTYSLSSTVNSGITVTVAYTQPGDGIADAAPNYLATLSGFSLTNNSTQGGGGGAGTVTIETLNTGALNIGP